MIIIPKITPVPQSSLHRSFLGNLPYNWDTNSFKFPQSLNINSFYPPRTVPPCTSYRVTHTLAKNNIFVIGSDSYNFRVIGKNSFRFQIEKPVHTVCIMGDQVFYGSSTHLYSTVDSITQSTDIGSIDMDVSTMSNELYLLNKNNIKQLGGTRYPLSCRDPKKIMNSTHPRTLFLFTEKSGFIVDLRSKNANHVYTSGTTFMRAVKNDRNVVVQTVKEISVLDIRYDSTPFSKILWAGNRKIACNNKYLISWRNNFFTYFNINNLVENKNFQYDIHDLVTFAVDHDKYYFFRKLKIDEFNEAGKHIKHYAQVETKYSKDINVDFFREESCTPKICTEYLNIDDIESQRLDDIMMNINKEMDYQTNVLTEEKKVVERKIKRKIGF